MSEHQLTKGRSLTEGGEQNGGQEKTRGAGTDYVHAGYRHDETTGAVVPPIHFATTYAQSEPGVHKGFDYTRSANPTRRVFEDAIAQVEHGAHGFAFASGLAATDTLLRLLSPGDEVVASRNLYGGTHRLFEQVLARYGLTFRFVDAREPENVQAALTAKTRMVFLETPTNPNLELADIAAITSDLRAFEEQEGTKIIAVVDNTFATPYNQNPLDLGADVTLHSVTKYLGGHSDVLGGALAVRDEDLGEKLGFHQNAIGGVMDPFSAYLAHRGLKTLHVRMQRHAENAQKIAAYLEGHQKVRQVWFPGLESHDQHALAKKQMRTPGGMVSFELEGGLESGKRFMQDLNVWTLAESLGAVESLVNHPVTMTHGSIPKQEREAAGITDGLVRLSVGIEEADDLIADLERSLAGA